MRALKHFSVSKPSSRVGLFFLLRNEGLSGCRKAPQTYVLTEVSFVCYNDIMEHKVEAMPTIAEKNGVKVFISYRLGKHQAPYIKAKKGGQSVSVLIETAEVVIGDLPPKDLKMVVEYVQKNKEKLLKAWDITREGKTPSKIPFDVVASWEAPKLLKIVALPNLILKGIFADGKVKTLDLGEILQELSGDLVSPIKNQSFFEKVTTDGELISWPNDFDLEAVDLYELGEDVDKIAASI